MNTEIRNNNSEVSYKKRAALSEYTKEFRHEYVSEATSPGIESKNRRTWGLIAQRGLQREKFSLNLSQRHRLSDSQTQTDTGEIFTRSLINPDTDSQRVRHRHIRNFHSVSHQPRHRLTDSQTQTQQKFSLVSHQPRHRLTDSQTQTQQKFSLGLSSIQT